MKVKRKPRVQPWQIKIGYYDGDLILGRFYTDEGVRKFKRTGTSDLPQAMIILEEHLSYLKRESKPQKGSMSIGQAFNKMWKNEWHKQKDHRKRRQQAKAIEDWFGSDTLLKDITSSWINDYIEYLRDDLGNSDATINRKTAVLKRTLNVACHSWEEIDKVPYIPQYREKMRGHRQTMTSAEFQVILQHCTDYEHEVFFLVLWDTGCRPSELINLTGDELDTIDAALKLEDSKGGKARTIPVKRALMDKLVRLNRGEVRPFLNVTGSSYRSQFDKGRKALGQMDNPKFTAYSMRHTKAKALLNQGYSVAFVMDWLGHASITTTQIYVETNDNELLRARDAQENE
jgi:integrase